MKRILILFGGNSYEHSISCNSVNFILKNIDKRLFDYSVVGIDYNNDWYEVNKDVEINNDWKNNCIKKINDIIKFAKKFDKVFPVIHGNTGEDGKLQSLFEMFNIDFVGCDSHSSLICYDKLLTKLILEKYNIPQVPYTIYNDETNLNNIKYPVIVKPCKSGSSIGINVVYKKKDIMSAINNALKYDNTVIIEKFIKENKELECALLECDNKLIVSNVGEIKSNGKWYDYNEKYNVKRDTIISNIDVNTKNTLQDIAKKIFKILKCKNLSRIDFIYDLKEKRLYFNEINTIPGFTEISMYPKLIKNFGISYRDLISYLLF